MDDFPDELLLLVFSFLEDGATLLDAVPLVCKRWRQLARDPDAWRGVRVRVELKAVLSPDEEQCVKESARVILRAPALRSMRLRLDHGQKHTQKQPRTLLCRYVIPALSRSDALIRELHLAEHFERLERGVTAAVLDLLWRCRYCLRVVCLGRLSVPYHDETETINEQTVLYKLAGLQSLEELQVGVSLGLPPASASPVPSIDLPHLRRLALDVLLGGWEDTHTHGVDPDEALPVKLVRSCADSLRHLQLDCSLPGSIDLSSHVSLMRQLCRAMRLAQCASLHSLATDLLFLGACCGDLHQLRTLRLRVRRFEFPLLWDNLGEDVVAIVDDLVGRAAAEPPLRGLQTLVLDCHAGAYFSEDKRPLVVEEFVAIARLAANANSLRVVTEFPAQHGDMWHGHVPVPVTGFYPLILRTALPAMLDCMPGLRHLAFDGDPWAGVAIDVLPRLLGLRDLRQVSGRLLATSPEELALCEEAIASFRQHRPDVLSEKLMCSLKELGQRYES